MDDFEAAWLAYPRKVSKKEAQRAWARLTQSQRFEVAHALPIHARYWQAKNTEKDYIPHFATWLNQERWTDEIELPTPKDSMGDWWKTPSGILAKARAIGMDAKPGEGYHELKARILAKERAA